MKFFNVSFFRYENELCSLLRDCNIYVFLLQNRRVEKFNNEHGFIGGTFPSVRAAEALAAHYTSNYRRVCEYVEVFHQFPLSFQILC